MHQVEIEVVCAEVLEGVAARSLDVLRLVVQLEQLGSDEELFAGDTAGADTLSHLGLITVRPGAATNKSRNKTGGRGDSLDVAVTAFDGGLDGLGDFSGFRLPLEGKIV